MGKEKSIAVVELLARMMRMTHYAPPMEMLEVPQTADSAQESWR